MDGFTVDTNEESTEESTASVSVDSSDWPDVIADIELPPSSELSVDMNATEEKENLSDLDKVKKYTSEVTSTEAFNKCVGQIKYGLHYKNGVTNTIMHVTGILIHPRLVLTCAHFLRGEIEESYKSAIVDTNSTVNTDHGIEFNVDPKSDALIVKNILENSPFQHSGLQIGDVIKKWGTKFMPDISLGTIVAESMNAVTFQNKINAICATKNQGQVQWELHIVRQGVCLFLCFKI